MTEIEIELKTLLTEEEFRRLCDAFGLTDRPPLVQVNQYFDTPDEALKTYRCALRLRRYPDDSEWTLKMRETDHQSAEYTQDNSARGSSSDGDWDLARELQDPDLLAALSRLGIQLDQLQPTYQMTTERWWVPAPAGQYALDRTRYLDQVDYELELETQDLAQARTCLSQLLDDHDIPYRPAPYKIQRVADYYQAQ